MRSSLSTLTWLALAIGGCSAGPEPLPPTAPGSAAEPPIAGAAPSTTTVIPKVKAADTKAEIMLQPNALVTPEHAAAPIPAPAPPTPQHKRSGQPLEGQSRLYDRSNPMYPELQQANQSLAGFPADRLGRVDWVAALRQGLIKPRAERGGGGRMRLLDNDVIMTNTRDMPWVRFPHAAHTEWLACSNCHGGIFKAERGANQITMDDIFQGRYCGVCHDRVAFSVFICERCHSITHDGSPEAWWDP